MSLKTNLRRHRAQAARADLKDRIGPAAQQTRERTTDGMLAVRSWGAPRLRRAAGYVEADLAPRVSSLLADTAERVEPPARRRRRVRTVALTAVGMLALIGVAGAVMTRRTNLDPYVQEPHGSVPETESRAAREAAADGETPSRSVANGERP